ncbi:MAG TPA: NfeD family protein, partial [Candidatus Hydrogenedentes bacterium]|nr:NfeD family protein [Candidatus Hydrogenedentota bacterium]
LGITRFPEYALWLILGGVGAVAAVITLGLWGLSRSGFFRRNLTLSTAQHAGEGWVSAPSDASLIGMEGVTVTPLRPAGAAMISGKRVDVVTDGVYIEEGQRVRVREVHGSRILVEPADIYNGSINAPETADQ